MGSINLNVVLLALLPLGGVLAILEPLQLPEPMAECIRYRTDLHLTGNETVPYHTIGAYCLNDLLYKTEKLRTDPLIANETLSFVAELFRKMIAEHTASRQKRNAYPMRIRREIRMMSPAERRRFFHAVVEMKRRQIRPGYSVYDYIADVHRIVADSAHVGPAFYAWHRIYLLVFEHNLGPGIAVPYWDCRLDYYMQDPTESIVWSSEFFGNGYGRVTTGPFANWVTSQGRPLVRNIGSGGSLWTDEAVNLILSQTNSDAITEPSKYPAKSAETHHNGPHIWVDGLMGGLRTSAHDPVFFIYHSFIDYIWTEFRARNPAAVKQYPNKGSKLHRANAQMYPFTIRNIDGYSSFYDGFVRYAPTPVRCPCHSPYLECGPHGRCISVRGAEQRLPPYGNAARIVAEIADVNIGRRFPTSFVDPRTRGRVSTTDVEGRRGRFVRSVQENTTQVVVSQMTYGDSQLAHGYVNSFELDGVQDETAWAYIPVRVIFEKHTKLSVDGSEVAADETVYGNCQPSGAGAAKIFVQTDGLDYSGRYKDYVIVDERQDISSTVAYVGVKSPEISESHFIMTAFDTCGRVCSPRCYNKGSYVPCSGTFYLNDASSTGYSRTKQEAIDSVWKNGEGLLAEPNSESIPVALLCETGNSLPWNI